VFQGDWNTASENWRIHVAESVTSRSSPYQGPGIGAKIVVGFCISGVGGGGGGGYGILRAVLKGSNACCRGGNSWSDVDVLRWRIA
jgi:hypothetical protein